MDSFIIISDCSDSENSPPVLKRERSYCRLLRRNNRLKRRSRYSPEPDTSTSSRASLLDQDIIDLTSNGCAIGALSESDSDIIDLTGIEDHHMFPEISSTLEDCFIPEQRVKSECQFNRSPCRCTLEDTIDCTDHVCWSCSTSSLNKSSDGGSVYEDQLSEGSMTTLNSDLGSLESMIDDVLEQDDSDVVETSDCLACEKNQGTSINNKPVLPDFHRPASCFSRLSPDYAKTITTGRVKTSPTTSRTPIKEAEESEYEGESSIQAAPYHKAWLFKLGQFKNYPVHHLFFIRLKQEEGARKNLHLKSQPIPSRRMNIVSSTVEESFSRGTLHFLNDFVSPLHYPPTVNQYPLLDPPILCHVIRFILLGAEEQSVINEAYSVLMKVQELHPAKLSTVPWDWNLLTDVMEKKEHLARLLFLQYVVQTLADDFQLNVRRRCLQNCLSKTMLSCDKSFSNIRDIIKWLIDTVKSSSETCNLSESDYTSVKSDNQREICLLQRMLSIAVDVDKTPTCSSNRIAEYMFSDIISISTRYQREMLFSSIESALLRAKVLEVIFHHSCEQYKSLPLSLGKILYFMEHSTLLLEEQKPGGEWQRWDELLHLICLLFLSYKKIMLDRLLTPVTDRIDHILQVTKPVTLEEDVTEADVEIQLSNFKTRTSNGTEVPAAILARLHVLRALLCSAVQHHS